MKDVLIVDDEPSVAEALRDLLTRAGKSAGFVLGADAALAEVDSGRYRAVLLDLRIPGVTGLNLLEEIRRRAPRLPVVMMTAYGSIRTAVDAVKKGALDFITKPIDKGELMGAVDRALRQSEAEAGTSVLYFDRPGDRRVVFRDPASLKLVEEVRRASTVNLPVLLTGESGVGKEVFARLLHEMGPRAPGPFVKVNCAALPEALFESELFGHEKGAFSGAIVAKPGRVEIAEGGTLFLDEIGELSKPAQAKLLQFLQDRTFERIGGVRTLRADVRIVAATNRDLKEALREDLYFRLCGVQLAVPPLRERPADIESLATHIVARSGRPMKWAPGALDSLRAYPWPGNVRELEQRLERALAFASDGVLEASQILPAPQEASSGLREDRKAFERSRIENALRLCNGNRTEAAESLGISRRMLHKKLKSLGIE